MFSPGLTINPDFVNRTLFFLDSGFRVGFLGDLNIRSEYKIISDNNEIS